MLVPGSSTSSNWGSQKKLGKTWLPVMDPFAPFCSFCTKNLCFVMRPAVPPQCRDRGGEVQSLLLLGLGCVMGIFRRQDSLWGNAPRVIELTLILSHVLAMRAVTHWEGAPEASPILLQFIQSSCILQGCSRALLHYSFQLRKGSRWQKMTGREQLSPGC